MKFSNWFKIVWWLIILLAIGFLLYQRYADISQGKGNSVDLFILVIWVALALSPLFQEISLPGITLKQQIREIKDDIKQELINIKTAIVNSVDVRTQISTYYPVSPPDNSLPDLENRFKLIITDVLKDYGITSPKDGFGIPKIDDNTLYLFTARYSIEKEIRRIWEQRIKGEECKQNHPISVISLIPDLISAELIPRKLGVMIREVYSVCSPAIHGGEISDAKVNFVKDVVPDLLSVLRTIH